MPIARGVVFLVGALLLGGLPACHAPQPPNSAPQPPKSAPQPPNSAPQPPNSAPQPPNSAGAAPALASGAIRRKLIEKQPVSELPGWETRLYLIEYGPGAVAPLHVHPVVGTGLVLEGSFESAFGDEAPTRVRTGEGFVDPAGVPHRLFRNLSADHALRFVVAYTIRVGQEIFYPGASVPPP